MPTRMWLVEELTLRRVMDCGDAGHILVSRTTIDLLRQVGDWTDVMHDIGEVSVKHGAIVHLYNVYQNEFWNPKRPRKLRAAESVGLGDVLLDNYRLLEKLGDGGVGIVFPRNEHPVR